MFFSPRYLRVLEDSGPENLRPCYALIFNDKEPVAAIAAQSVAVSIARLRKSSSADDPLSRHEEKMLVCGNLLSFGMHGISFAPNVDHKPLWPVSYRSRDCARLQATLSRPHGTRAQSASRRSSRSDARLDSSPHSDAEPDRPRPAAHNRRSRRAARTKSVQVIRGRSVFTRT